MEHTEFLEIKSAFTQTSALSQFKAYTDTLPNQSRKMPVLFTAHGSPMQIPRSEEEYPFWNSLHQLGVELQRQYAIRAVLVVSAHWCTNGTFVNIAPQQTQLYDYYGFPPEYYQPRYEAEGAPAIGAEIARLVPLVEPTTEWGLDHGAWPMLMHLFPQANVPVFQLSIHYHAAPGYHYHLARQLKSLREKGVLIIGSGAPIHNLSLVRQKLVKGDMTPYGWEADYDGWLKEQLDGRNVTSFLNYQSSHLLGKTASPTPDHFVPVLYSLGLMDPADELRYFHEAPPACRLLVKEALCCIVNHNQSTRSINRKAVIIKEYGTNDVIDFVADAPKPSAQANQLIVEVHSASLNPIDSMIRAGYLHQMPPLNFPAVLAGDFAGVVVETGSDVESLKAGDQVYGQAGPLMGGSGSLAEFTAVASTKVALKPTSLTMDQAGALPLTGTSAVQAIEEHIRLQRGQRILIHGGMGGVGSLAIQLAKYHGAFVATTVEGHSLEAARQLGADQVIDYRTQDFTQLIHEFDAVLVNVEDALAGSYQVLRKGGVLVSLVSQLDQNRAQVLGITAHRQVSQVNADQLTRLAILVDAGAIKPVLANQFTLDQTKAAFTYFEQARPQGKITVTIR